MLAHVATPQNLVEAILIYTAVSLPSVLAQSLVPDVLVSFNPNRFKTNRVMEVIYRKIAHASHFAQNRCGFALEVCAAYADVAARGNPDPYGNGTERRAGLMALTEAWGEYVGAT